ncbi:MAG: hypothetical protein PVF63_10910 [Gammaproteobacteria bacterium]|jgi:predicted SnoaL-like aldol condensation-catalyzing enzyme
MRIILFTALSFVCAAACAQYPAPQQTSCAMNADERVNMQHNRNVPGGRDRFMEFFGSRAREARPLDDNWITPPTLELVSGNFHLRFDKRFEDAPGNSSHQSACYRFDLIRADDGVIQEQWDVAFPNQIER